MMNQSGSETPMTKAGTDNSPSMVDWTQDFNLPQGDFDAFGEMQDVNGFSPNMQSPPVSMGMPSYQQPLLPQDLFALPMTLDWNWAEMSGGAYPTVENGNFGGGIAPDQFRQHQQQQ